MVQSTHLKHWLLPLPSDGVCGLVPTFFNTSHMIPNSVVLFMYPITMYVPKSFLSTMYAYTPTFVDLTDHVYVLIASRMGICTAT